MTADPVILGGSSMRPADSLGGVDGIGSINISDLIALYTHYFFYILLYIIYYIMYYSILYIILPTILVLEIILFSISCYTI